MKRFFFTATVLFAITSLTAQTADQGNKYLYYERYNSAEKSFKQAVEQQPNDGAAWLGLTKTYLLQQQQDKAATALAAAPATVKENPQFLVAYGQYLMAQGKKDSAAIYFDKALSQTKEKDAQVLMAVAEAHILYKDGDANRAMELLQKAAKRDKRNPAVAVLMGNAYRKLGNGGEAFRAYQEAISKDDKYAAAHYQLGDIFLSQKDEDLYVEHFQKAVAADPAYAPALQKLYAYQFYHDPAKAKQYYDQYLANTDTSIQNQYDLADLLYVAKEYNQAIDKAKYIMGAEGEKTQPRIYKLVGYSYAGLKDTAQATTFMQQYFDKAADSNLVAKDFVAMAEYLTAGGNDSLAAENYAKAVALEKDSAALYTYYRKLADIATARKDFASQAKWLHAYYQGNKDASNLDLFNTGLAYFRAENYAMADSIYGMYTEKYPDQSFGYYWQAKSKALLDPEMKEGLAIPVYQKLIELLQQNTADPNYQKWMIESYGYLAAYEANSQKDYPEAIGYFEKILEVDPDNADAKKYIAILEKDAAGK